MADLSNYIHKELNTLRTKIQQTPPKKVVSLKKIQRLVDEAPIKESQKKQLCRSIHTVEIAMKRSSKKLIVKNEYAKNLFYDNLLLEERNLNKKRKKVHEQSVDEEKDEYKKLMRKLEEVRKARLKRQDYLCGLIVQSQRLQRLLNVQRQNQDRYLRSKQLDKEFSMKKKKEEKMKEEVRNAVKDNRRRTVHTLMAKYNNFLVS